MAWGLANEAGLAVHELEKKTEAIRKIRKMHSLVGLKRYDEATYDKLRELGQKALDALRRFGKKLLELDSHTIERYSKIYSHTDFDLKKALAEAGLTIKDDRVVEIPA